MRISAGEGTDEAALITGGTCEGGLGSGTLIFTTANAHTGGWVIGSAAMGFPEAIRTGVAQNLPVHVLSDITLYAPTTIPNSTGLEIICDSGSRISAADAVNYTALIHNASNTGISDLTIRGCTFDGNYRNQTSGNRRGVFLAQVKRPRVIDNVFEYFGDADYSVGAEAVYMRNSPGYVVRGNRFYSNNGVAIQVADEESALVPSSDGGLIEANTLGISDIQSARTNVDWWDTGVGGGSGISVLAGKNTRILGNTAFGLGWNHTSGVTSQPLGVGNCANCTISGNTIYGLAAGYGTISVTNGSGTVTGTDINFNTTAAPDPYSFIGSFLEVEGDATLYQVTAVASATSFTVSPVIDRATASGLRYKINKVGDLGGFSQGLTNSVISNNGFFYGHDNGISMTGGTGSDENVGNIISGNTIARNYSCGILVVNGHNRNVFSDNNILDNGQSSAFAALVQYQSGICMETASGTIAGNVFAGNVIQDRQASATQEYAFHFPASAVNVNANAVYGNNIRNNNTGVVNSEEFFMAVFSDTNWYDISVTFADLDASPVARTGTPVIFCRDCTVASPCSGSGTGALAKRLDSQWVCN